MKRKLNETETDEDHAVNLMRKQSERVEAEILKVTSSKRGNVESYLRCVMW